VVSEAVAEEENPQAQGRSRSEQLVKRTNSSKRSLQRGALGSLEFF